MMQSSDFCFTILEWSTSRQKFNSQIELLRQRVETYRPDVMIINNIPRHHAKKLSQCDWSKDYYVSKEKRNVTVTARTKEEGQNKPTPITVIFCKYPTSSEEWFALEQDAGFAHVVEICIPLNAWKTERCPLSLLQEYQLTYDEVSSITIVVSSTLTEELQATFNAQNVHNSVIFISGGGGAAEPEVKLQLRHWERLNSPKDVIYLSSSVGESE
jgi:hypothetical protein